LLKILGKIYVPKTVYQEICLNVDIKNEWPEWIKIKELSESDQRESIVLTRIADSPFLNNNWSSILLNTA
jgi:predicted nucleic acid-binding protein